MSRNECDAIRPLISAALDGDLDEQEFVQLSEHLASCPSCLQIHRDYSQIGDGLRASPAPAPPPDLARSVWQKTVDKPADPAVIRFASRVSLRFGMSTMAASVVALLAAVLFLAHGYDQRSIPSVVSSKPTQESVEDWPISRPVEIEFDKQMNQKSVEENLVIRPTIEQERLPTSWVGNTFIIGRSEDQSVLLRPQTDYRITVLEHAEDRHGNPLGQFWELQFRTGQPEVAVATPSPEPDDSDYDPEPHDQMFEGFWSFGGSEAEDLNGTPEEGEDPGQVEEPVDDETGHEETAEIVEDPTPVPPPAEEDTDSADSNESVEQAPAPTEAPEPTATPKPEPTPEPTPTQKPETPPTAEPYPVRGAFGEVYWGNASVKDALGEPVQEARSFLGSEQEFQRGLMFRQHHDNHSGIVVFVNSGRVQWYDNNYDPHQHDFPVGDIGDGFYKPGGFFGKVWSENGHLESEIGLAVSPDPIRDIDAATQQFERGTLLYSRGNVYVIYDDNSWNRYQVRGESSGGFQGSDDYEQEYDQHDDADLDEEVTPEATTEPEQDADPDDDSQSDSDESSTDAQDD